MAPICEPVPDQQRTQSLIEVNSKFDGCYVAVHLWRTRHVVFNFAVVVVVQLKPGSPMVGYCIFSSRALIVIVASPAIGGFRQRQMGEIMKFKFAFALVVASTVLTQGNYAYALDCSATNLSTREKQICALRAAVAAGAKKAPGDVTNTPVTITNRCAGQKGQALIDCKRFNSASCIPLPAGVEKNNCIILYGG